MSRRPASGPASPRPRWRSTPTSPPTRPNDLLEEYAGLRKRLGGIAIARLVGNSCGGCHLQLSAVEVARLKKLAPDEPANCEECGRLLAR
jgi:predicted  nucleic acid-binding Zn-ribbon protein